MEIERRRVQFASASFKSITEVGVRFRRIHFGGRLVGEIRAMALDAVMLNAISPPELETEAKAKQCDFILYTDIAMLKISAAKKLGGLFGKATGVGSGGIDKTEAKVEFKLFAVGEPSPRCNQPRLPKRKATKISAGTALDQEAKQVSAEARKKGRRLRQEERGWGK